METPGREPRSLPATPPGGRATVGSLLPSKVWLHTAQEQSHRTKPIAPEEAQRAAAGVRTAIGERVAWTRSALEQSGVTVISGNALLTGSNSVSVTDSDGTATTLEAERIVLANGSEPIFFPGVKPDGERMIAPRHTQKLTEIPEKLIMVGGGVTGVEYSSVFARLGSNVHMLSYDELLPRSDREYTAQLADTLRGMGVTIETGVAVDAVENTGDGVTVHTKNGATHSADSAFIATGRAGDLSFFGAGAPELATDKSGRFLAVDTDGRTSVESIFACGDVTGPPLTANKAVYQARRAVQAILSAGTSPQSPVAGLIEAVYTTPQLAGVGPVLELAQRSDLVLHRKSYAISMLSHVHNKSAHPGEVKIWTDQNGTVLGAAAIGEQAAEILAPIQVTMQYGGTLEQLSAVPFAYPSFSEVVTS